MLVRPSWICFPLDNLSSTETNHFKIDTDGQGPYREGQLWSWPLLAGSGGYPCPMDTIFHICFMLRQLDCFCDPIIKTLMKTVHLKVIKEFQYYKGDVVVVIVWYFTNTCAISACHYWSCEFESCSWRGVLDTILCDKVCYWVATGWGFPPGTPISFTNKTDIHDINELLLKVALTTIYPNPNPIYNFMWWSVSVTSRVTWHNWNIVESGV